MRRRNVCKVGLGRALLAVGACVALLAAGCARETSPLAKQGAPIKLGVVTATTSPFALVGIKVRDGAQLAVEEINAQGGVNGHPLQLVTEDTSDSNTTAVNAVNKVLSQDPVAVLGPIYGTQNLALSPVIKREEVPLFYGSGTSSVSTQGNRWLFGLTASDDIAARALLRFVAENLKAKRIAVEYVNNEYGKGAARILQEQASAYGTEIVAAESHAADDKDMAAQLLRIKQARPDAVIVWGHPADTAVIAKQLKQYAVPGYKVGPTAPVLPVTLDLLPEDVAEGWYGEWASFTSPQAQDPKTRTFVESYKKKYGKTPDFFDAQYYDAIYMLRDAIRAALEKDITGIDKLRVAIRDHLSSLRYEGIGGAAYDFDEQGRGPHQFVIVNVKPGKQVAKVAQVGT